MKRSLHLAAFVLVLAAMSYGCAWTHFGVGDTSEVVSKEFEVLGPAEGKLYVWHVLGFIPTNFHPDMDRVLDQMEASRMGDAVINIRTYERYEWYLVCTRLVTVVEGDVIRYKSDEPETTAEVVEVAEPQKEALPRIPSGLNLVDESRKVEWLFGPDQDMSWIDSKKWAENREAFGGGWRLPTMAELQILYQSNRVNVSCFFWSSELSNEGRRRFVDFHSGKGMESTPEQDANFRVVAIRNMDW